MEYLNYFINVCYEVSHEFQNGVYYCGFVQIDCLNYWKYDDKYEIDVDDIDVPWNKIKRLLFAN